MSGVPPPRKLTERMVLPMFNGTSFDTIFVDDRGTCSIEQHPISEGGFVPPRSFHRYRDEKGQFWALRCPSSLTEEEQLSAIPEASALRVLSERAEARRGSRKSKRDDDGGYE